MQLDAPVQAIAYTLYASFLLLHCDNYDFVQCHVYVFYLCVCVCGCVYVCVGCLGHKEEMGEGKMYVGGESRIGSLLLMKNKNKERNSVVGT